MRVGEVTKCDRTIEQIEKHGFPVPPPVGKKSPLPQIRPNQSPPAPTPGSWCPGGLPGWHGVDLRAGSWLGGALLPINGPHAAAHQALAQHRVSWQADGKIWMAMLKGLRIA